MTDPGVLRRLSDVIESRKPGLGGSHENSYVARLFERGSDAILKKLGEEATEVVMAAKDADHEGRRQRVVEEMADLWFHSLVTLSHYGFTHEHVLTELERREGLGGLDEKASREDRRR